MLREPGAKIFHFGGLLGIRQRTVWLKCLLRLAHCHLVGQHGDAARAASFGDLLTLGDGQPPAGIQAGADAPPRFWSWPASATGNC